MVEETLLFFSQYHSIHPFVHVHQGIGHILHDIRLPGSLGTGYPVKEFLVGAL
jgi:hypothetical protein